ncbi:hypothetical protein L873DRAFT_1809184 [Choiromyces venosus 120613-1]|uniref:Uncharacterized protein n=1 Tax=Choiromyces venosus 120613-1 TaxID=1336337 RepID=A0A3N4JLW5_9PEZI|nr:hypothetical protein L873DRAFT_1809184 [Choiromyces venosus 120613-1]
MDIQRIWNHNVSIAYKACRRPRPGPALVLKSRFPTVRPGHPGKILGQSGRTQSRTDWPLRITVDNTAQAHAYRPDPHYGNPAPRHRSGGVGDRSDLMPRSGVEYGSGYGYRSDHWHSDSLRHDAGYQQQRDYVPALHEPDKLELGQQRPVTNCPRREEGSLGGRQGGSSSEDKLRDPSERVLCRINTENQPERSEDVLSEYEVDWQNQ